MRKNERAPQTKQAPAPLWWREVSPRISPRFSSVEIYSSEDITAILSVAMGGKKLAFQFCGSIWFYSMKKKKTTAQDNDMFR